jgi:hypothetical protein
MWQQSFSLGFLFAVPGYPKLQFRESVAAKGWQIVRFDGMDLLKSVE